MVVVLCICCNSSKRKANRFVPTPLYLPKNKPSKYNQPERICTACWVENNKKKAEKEAEAKKEEDKDDDDDDKANVRGRPKKRSNLSKRTIQRRKKWLKEQINELLGEVEELGLPVDIQIDESKDLDEGDLCTIVRRLAKIQDEQLISLSLIHI